jgi:hypothetical protein
VRVGGDPDATWTRAVSADLGAVEAVRPGGTVLISLTAGADSQRILDLARAAGPVEHFTFEARRLSEVFRQVTGASVGQAEAEHAASAAKAAGTPDAGGAAGAADRAAAQAAR